jgi:hypothetical protein
LSRDGIPHKQQMVSKAFTSHLSETPTYGTDCALHP